MRSLIHVPFCLILFPVLFALVLIRVAMGIVSTALTTMLFFILGVLYGIYRVIRLVLNTIFYLPLRAFALSFEAFRRGYGVALRGSLRLSFLFLVLVVLVTVHAGYLASQLGRELMPPMRQGEFSLRMEIRAGARLEETEMRARRFEQIIRELPELDSVTVEIGEEEQSSGNDRGKTWPNSRCCCGNRGNGYSAGRVIEFARACPRGRHG